MAAPDSPRSPTGSSSRPRATISSPTLKGVNLASPLQVQQLAGKSALSPRKSPRVALSDASPRGGGEPSRRVSAMGTDEPSGWASETELLRAFEPWRFEKFMPPGAYPARTQMQSAPLQRTANTLKWQQRQLRACVHEEKHDLTWQDSAKSRDVPAAVARFSKFVPPADAPSAPKTARGLGAVLSRVTSLLSFVGTGPAPEAQGASPTQVRRWREKRFRAAAPCSDSKASLKPIVDSVNDDFPLVSVDEEQLLFVDKSQAIQQLPSQRTGEKVTPQQQSPSDTMPATQAPSTMSGVDRSSGHGQRAAPRAAVETVKAPETLAPGIKRDTASFLWKLCDGYGPLLPDGWAMCACNVPVKLEWGSCPRCGASTCPL